MSGTKRVADHPQPSAVEPVDRAAAAAYVAELAGNLALLARRHGLDALGFILDMAQLEAQESAVGRDRRSLR